MAIRLDSTTRALTVRQPWAFAIAEGFKPVENRSKPTRRRGEIYLHAGKTLEKGISIVRYSRDAARRLDELGGHAGFWDAIAMVPSRFYTSPASLACSAIIATARITGCHQATEGCCAPWGEANAWHWVLAEVVALPESVSARGQLGFWRPAAEVLAAVQSQLDGVSV